jgi:hypothetical protein
MNGNNIRKVVLTIKQARQCLKALAVLEAKDIEILACGHWISGSELVFADYTRVVKLNPASVRAVVDGETETMKPYEAAEKPHCPYIIITATI